MKQLMPQLVNVVDDRTELSNDQLEGGTKIRRHMVLKEQ